MNEDKLLREIKELRRDVFQLKEKRNRSRLKRVFMLIIVTALIPIFMLSADTVTKPYTFTDGTVISAAEVNANFDTLYTKVNDLDAELKGVAVRVYNSTNLLLTSASPRILNFDSEVFDTDNMHDNSINNSRLTVNTTGLYLIYTNIIFQIGSTSNRSISIKLNGGTHMVSDLSVGGSVSPTYLSITTIDYLSAGDYLDVTAIQNSGFDNNVVGGKTVMQFGMVKLVEN